MTVHLRDARAEILDCFFEILNNVAYSLSTLHCSIRTEMQYAAVVFFYTCL